jgi:hypothetical protein
LRLSSRVIRLRLEFGYLRFPLSKLCLQFFLIGRFPLYIKISGLDKTLYITSLETTLTIAALKNYRSKNGIMICSTISYNGPAALKAKSPLINRGMTLIKDSHTFKVAGINTIDEIDVPRSS